ncbi:hypothetical protein BLOT_008001 [Blomia tropicalis]|nr:hypothetical protein BLOT_008001 [Blomia tropicalis]
MNFQTQNECRLLVNRANCLIEKYNLPVPRFFSTRFLNFEFWAMIFTHVFGINCNRSLRTPFERLECIKTCLNTLSSLMEKDLSHIQPNLLLESDVTTMSNLIQIAEVWDQSLSTEYESLDKFKSLSNENLTNNIDQNNQNILNQFCSISDNNLNRYHDANSEKLAVQLYHALKNQMLALEIEKKLKIYLGDVTVSQIESCNLRASRQSIVRTRAIQPRSTFDFSLHRAPKHNQVLSIELEKLFPELCSSDIISKIRQQEQSLVMTKNNIKMWHENLAMNKVGRTLDKAIDQQKQSIDLMHKDWFEKESVRNSKSTLVRNNSFKSLQRDQRARKAKLHREIDNFYRESTAAFKNARSHLERILVLEFRKADHNKRQQIEEIRRYLKDHYETETEKLRTMLHDYQME